MGQDEFFGGSLALRILNPHTGPILCATADDKKQSQSQGVTEALCGGREERGVKGGEGADRRAAFA